MKTIVETHNIGCCVVTATYSYLVSAPANESTTPLPGVLCQLRIPSDAIVEHLDALTYVWDERINECWGNYGKDDAGSYRYKTEEHRLDTLTLSLDTAREHVAAAVTRLRKIYEDRVSAIARAHAVNPFADAPMVDPVKGQNVVEVSTGRQYTVYSLTTSGGRIVAFELALGGGSMRICPISEWQTTYLPVD